MRPPILITGAARSGTSLTAGIIHHCGGFGGDVTGSTVHNQKGQFENTHIRQHIVKPYLKRLGVDPLCQKPLPDVNKLDRFPGLYHEVIHTMRREGYVDGPWYYKGAKMCLLWPLWHEAFTTAHWIIVRRDTEDIANSCMRTPFMRAYKDTIGWLGWVEEHEQRFEEMKAHGALRVTEVFTEDIIKGNFTVIKKFVDNTDGLNWNEAKVQEFVTPELWKGGNR